MSGSAIVEGLEPPVPPQYQLQLGDELVWFFSNSPAGSVVYDCVNDRHYRLTTESLEPGVFRAELVA